MSYITPREYRTIANQIGAAYAALRDIIYTQGDPTSVYGMSEAITSSIVSFPDDDSLGPATPGDDSHTDAKDPIGSIANDLGSTSYQFFQRFSEANAKTIAASYFTTILSNLNTHVLNRTDTTNVTTMDLYYSTYAVNDSYEMSLHSANGSTMLAAYYFSADFAELAARLNITLTNVAP